MKIGIVETEHFEVGYTAIKLFDNGKNEITVFTHESSYRQFQYLFGQDIDHYNWIVRNEKTPEYKFINIIYKELRKRDITLLYLNTISSNFILYAAMISLFKEIRVVLTIHDINGYFNFRPALSIRRLVRFIGKRWLIHQVMEFNVISSTMVDYLRQKLPSNKNIHNVPGSFFDENPTCYFVPQNFTGIKIVIPGTVDIRRRDYEFVFDLLEKVNQKNLKLSFIFLGGINSKYGKHIIEKCRLYPSEILQFFETNIVDQPEFDRVMCEAHLALIPTVINTVLSDGITEIYGLSISSGNIFDVIKHAKPFIAPAELQIPPNIQSSSFRYTSEQDIIEFFENMFTNPGKYLTMKEHAIQNSKEYTIEKIRHRNSSLFNCNG